MKTDQKDETPKVDIRIGGQDAPTTEEMPLRMLILGDFTPEAPSPPDWRESSLTPLCVDKDTFPSVMQRLAPHLSLVVPNRLSERPQELTVDLHFPDMRGFHPEGIARQVSVLSKLLAVRQLARRLETRELELADFEAQLDGMGVDPAWIEQLRQRIAAEEARGRDEQTRPQQDTQPRPATTTARTPATKGDALDALWDMIDAGDEQAAAETRATAQPRASRPRSAAGKAVDGFVRTVVRPESGPPQGNRSIAQTIIDDIDQTLSRQINEILHHPKFQQLESAWRGLKFLIDRTDFRENVILELLPVHKADLCDAIHHQVVTPEYNDLTETPLAVMIADYEFDRTTVDIGLLGEIAEMAAGVQVPFIASIGPAFFGVPTPEELCNLPGLHAFLQKPEYTQWRSLRDKEASKYLVLTVPRFLLRLPYGQNGQPVKAFQLTEHVRSSAHHLWGNGAFAVATTLVRSFIEDGWCTRITGRRGGGLVGNLPVWTSQAAGKAIHIPLDAFLSQDKALEFVDAGLVVLSCRVNDDAAYVLSAPTVHRPKTYSTEEATTEAQLHATLPYQLFATHLSHQLLRIVREVSTGSSAQQVQEMLRSRFRAVLAQTNQRLPEDAVTVEVDESTTRPEHYDVILRLRPPFQILGRDVDLFLSLSLHR